MSAPHLSAQVTINLAALKANYLALKVVGHGAEMGAAIKGDAYGLGLEPCAKALLAVGCRSFFGRAAQYSS
jgi:alanine racemase